MGESLLPQCSCLRGPIKRDTRGFSTGIFGSKDHSILEPTRRLLLARFEMVMNMKLGIYMER
jgi:hypothetical protein